MNEMAKNSDQYSPLLTKEGLKLYRAERVSVSKFYISGQNRGLKFYMAWKEEGV